MEEPFVAIEILNWDDFNYRKDVKAATWFRLSHGLLMGHPEFYDFSHSELVAWIYILSLASSRSKSTFLLNFELARMHIKLDRKTILSAIEKLVRNQCIRVHVTPTLRERDAHVTQTGSTQHNITRHNTTHTIFDLEKVYERYPKKVGKKNGIKKAKSIATDPEKYKNLMVAVENYSQYVASNKVESKFVKQFDTFMGCWEDWINPDPSIFNGPNKPKGRQGVLIT